MHATVQLWRVQTAVLLDGTFLSVGLFAPSAFRVDTEKCHAVGEEAGIHTRPPSLPEAKSLRTHLATWAEPQYRQTGDSNCCEANEPCHVATTGRGTSSPSLAPLSSHGATRCRSQGHMPLTLPVPGKGARDPQGCTWGSTCPATVDCRDVWGSRGKAMQGRPKLSLTYLGLMKPKGVVSKTLPFSEIFLSDVFNSTWSVWAVICLWPAQAVLNNVFIWDIIKYGSQQDSLIP